MHRHVDALLVMLIIVVLVIHTLFNLQYNHRAGKTATAKQLGAEKGISVWEAERRLDANVFLDEIPSWEPSKPHCLYLYQRMFAHTEGAGWKECDCKICRGCWQPSLERDLWLEVPAMVLLTQETTQEEIMALYHQVNQLKRNPGEVPCSEDTAEEILEMLKECL